MQLTPPQPINPNPSPKARFQASADNIAKHRKLLDQPELQRAFDFAVLQYSAEVTSGIKDQLTAIAAAAKVQAVHEFIGTFRMLSEQTQPMAPRKDSDNLVSGN